nr:hypothetical protein [Tanacetum cinerariifolium]
KTSSNTRNMNIDNTLRSNKRTEYDRQTGQYDNEWVVNVARARKNVADWRDDIDDELEDQELEAHYIYMEKIQEVIPDAANNLDLSLILSHSKRVPLATPSIDGTPEQPREELMLVKMQRKCGKQLKD